MTTPSIFRAHSVEELSDVAEQLLAAAQDARVFLFYGEMGAGKTTFIKAICTALGVTDGTSSPTFSIVNEYGSPDGPVYHFDFYRLKKESEALDLGYEEYLYSGQYCFIEWPERIAGLLPEHAAEVFIDALDEHSREIRLKTGS
jgi:tRNA threonylcarbamoyladenosine biosynthesis protein TsaE